MILQEQLRSDVKRLASVIGERNIKHYDGLCEASAFVEHSDSGYAVERQRYEAKGKPFDNLEVAVLGKERAEEIVVVGAHYDSAIGTPGANDNASSVAALLALARHFATVSSSRTLRLGAFTNEERPFLRTRKMGSRVYARRSRERGEKIVGMISLETIGYHSDETGSQRLSFRGRLLPRQGNFLALVGNRRSRDPVNESRAPGRVTRR